MREFLRREPEYDSEVVGTTVRDGKPLAVVVKKPEALRLTGGTYFISATLLQPVTDPNRGAFGPWNERLERNCAKGYNLNGLIVKLVKSRS